MNDMDKIAPDPKDEPVAPWAKDYAKISEEMGDKEFGKAGLGILWPLGV